jgi:hypothetical protein
VGADVGLVQGAVAGTQLQSQCRPRTEPASAGRFSLAYTSAGQSASGYESPLEASRMAHEKSNPGEGGRFRSENLVAAVGRVLYSGTHRGEGS